MGYISERFDCEIVTVKLGDICKIYGGSKKAKYSRDYAVENPGEYPVYTGKTTGAFASINTYDFDISENAPMLTFASVGEHAGATAILTGKFSLGQNRYIVEPSVKSLDVTYLKATLPERLWSIKKRGDVPTISVKEAKTLEVEVPVTPDGEFDLEKQKEIGDYLERFNKQVDSIKEQLKYLKKVVVTAEPPLPTGHETVTVKVGDIFNFSSGNDNLIKDYCIEHKGEYPVFSGSAKGPYGYIDTYDFDYPQITYVTYGSAGEIMLLEGKYSVGKNRARLIPINTDNLDLLYLKVALQPVFRKNIKKNDVPAMPWRLAKTLEVEIPVTPDGEFDLEKQKEIAEIWEGFNTKMDSIKEKIKFATSCRIIAEP